MAIEPQSRLSAQSCVLRCCCRKAKRQMIEIGLSERKAASDHGENLVAFDTGSREVRWAHEDASEARLSTRFSCVERRGGGGLGRKLGQPWLRIKRSCGDSPSTFIRWYEHSNFQPH